MIKAQMALNNSNFDLPFLLTLYWSMGIPYGLLMLNRF